MKLLWFSYSPCCFPPQAFAHVETHFSYHGLATLLLTNPLWYNIDIIFHNLLPPSSPWQAEIAAPLLCSQSNLYPFLPSFSTLLCSNDCSFSLFSPTAMRAGPTLYSPSDIPVLSMEPWTDAQQIVLERGSTFTPRYIPSYQYILVKVP